MNVVSESFPRLWQFGNAEFDEDRRELRVDGALRAVEAKPLAVLLELLVRRGDVATRDELMGAVWGGREVVANSLPTAINKLRLALGDSGRRVIASVPGRGYRIDVPIRLARARVRAPLTLALREGAPVPSRPGWRLERLVEANGREPRWRACHDVSAQRRIFVFAHTDDEIEALKRELAVARHLADALGERADLLPVVDADWESRPAFLAFADMGADLRRWAQASSGLASLPLAERVALVARIARTVAAAHGVGVLHGRIRPAAILLGSPCGNGAGAEAADAAAARPCLGGFGAASDAAAPGTLLTMAPEILAGGPPTVAGDVYALGILLFQMAVGDLDRPLGVGWVNGVADRLLSADIAAAANSDPQARLPSAALLAERLEALDSRRAAKAAQVEAEARAAALAEAGRRAQARRPWITMAAASLLLGMLAAGAATVDALRQRDQARAQARLAGQVEQFLTVDLLGRGVPAISGRGDETLMEAALGAEPRIRDRLATEPVVAAAIYRTLALAFDSRSAFGPAREAYAQAIAAFERGQRPGSADATVLRLRLVQMELQSADAGSVERARALLAAAAPRVGQLGARDPEAQAWLWNAQGMVALTGNGDVGAAQADFRQAVALAHQHAEAFDAETRFMLASHAAYTCLRLGQWAEADAEYGTLLRQQMALHGARHPDTLQVRLNLAQVLMARGQSEAAVASLDAMMDDLVAVFGTGHRFTFTALGARAEAEGRLGRYADAERDDATLYHMGLAKAGAQSFYAFGPLADMAASQCREGKAADGLRNAVAAHDASVASLGRGSAITEALGEDAGLCAALAGRYDQAAQLLEGVDGRSVAQFTAQPDFPAELELVQAAIASGTGHTEQARFLLRTPEAVFARPDADPYLRRWTARLQASLDGSQQRASN